MEMMAVKLDVLTEAVDDIRGELAAGAVTAATPHTPNTPQHIPKALSVSYTRSFFLLYL